MKNELTIHELEEYLKPLIHFGKVELEILGDEDGKKIRVYERDEYEYEDNEGNMVKDGDLTRPFTLYTSSSGVIGFIEHPFGCFTKANKDDAIYLLSLIGIKILL